MVDLAINPELDLNALGKAFAKSNRLQVRDFLTSESAEALYDQIVNHTVWDWTFREDDQVRSLAGTEHTKFPVDQQKALWRKAYLRAQDDQQFIYFKFDIDEQRAANPDAENPLFDLPGFLNSEPALSAAKTISGVGDIASATADAVWFSRDQFITSRDNLDDGDQNRLVFFIDLAKDWQADFGGLLQFFDDDMDLAEAFLPRFNSLTIFTVPQRHAMSYVTPFMENFRVGIAGCFKSEGAAS